jgi:hypothetical protein
MTDAIVTALLPLGLPGIMIIVLGWQYSKKDTKLEEANEKRIAEAREAIKAIEQNTNTLETLTEVLRDRKNN